jgi:hypothetical protein
VILNSSSIQLVDERRPQILWRFELAKRGREPKLSGQSDPHEVAAGRCYAQSALIIFMPDKLGISTVSSLSTALLPRSSLTGPHHITVPFGGHSNSRTINKY